MEKERIDAIEAELDLAIENFESAGDDINALRVITLLKIGCRLHK